MANHSGRGRSGKITKRNAPPSAFTEPEVRRWPHPVDGVAAAASGRRMNRQGAAERQQTPWPAAGGLQSDPALYYIHCALSYQNQLLADIKALLEQMAADHAPVAEE